MIPQFPPMRCAAPGSRHLLALSLWIPSFLNIAPFPSLTAHSSFTSQLRRFQALQESLSDYFLSPMDLGRIPQASRLWLHDFDTALTTLSYI